MGGVDYSSNIPHPFYKQSQLPPNQNTVSPSSPTSPTFSAITKNMGMPSELNVIEIEFQINKTFLREKFYSPQNTEKRNWFFTNFKEQKTQIQEIYYEFLNQNKIQMIFFDWLEIYSSDQNLFFPFTNYLNPITRSMSQK